MSVPPIKFQYTNYRGETAMRAVLLIRIEFGSTEWHPEPQWLLHGVDVDKAMSRTFALRDCNFTAGARAEDAAEIARLQAEFWSREKRDMALGTAVGAKVVFLSSGGYDGERENAEKILTVGAVYTVSAVEIGGFSSTVTLEGLGTFNTVMFGNTTPDAPA
jgi:hypothetical protein